MRILRIISKEPLKNRTTFHFVTRSYKPEIDQIWEDIFAIHRLSALEGRYIISPLKHLIIPAVWVRLFGWLTFQAQGIDYGAVAIDVFVLHVVQQSSASADKHQKTPAGMMIFFVNL